LNSSFILELTALLAIIALITDHLLNLSLESDPVRVSLAFKAQWFACKADRLALFFLIYQELFY
jgi:hypothetical protein